MTTDVFKTELFVYNRTQKRVKGIAFILGGIVLAGLIAAYLLFFRDINPFAGTFVESVFVHVKHHISALSYLGMFYVTFFGGLFFLSVPIDLIFIMGMGHNNPILLALVALAGLFPSYYIDYFIGKKFSGAARKIVSVKQFYKIKTAINKRGQIAIFLFNAGPMGSQLVTFVCGVFRYNPKRLFLMTALGQVTKYVFMVIFFGFLPFF